MWFHKIDQFRVHQTDNVLTKIYKFHEQIMNPTLTYAKYQPLILIFTKNHKLSMTIMIFRFLFKKNDS